MVSENDIVKVMENGGVYKGEVISTDLTDPDEEQLFSVIVTKMITPPVYDLEEGESTNVYPDEVAVVG
jgi:hypothetical protein